MENWRTNYKRYRESIASLIEKREDIRAYLGILLSLFTVSFFGIFALRPTLTTIGELVSQINTQRKTVETLNQKIENLEMAKINLQKVRSDLLVLDQAIPANPDPHIVIRQMETLAKTQTINPANISVGKTPILGASSQIEELQSYPFSFTFQGDTTNILSFFDKVKTLRRIVTIDRVTINRKAQSDSGDLTESSLLQLTISGDLPYYPK